MTPSRITERRLIASWCPPAVPGPRSVVSSPRCVSSSRLLGVVSSSRCVSLSLLPGPRNVVSSPRDVIPHVHGKISCRLVSSRRYAEARSPAPALLCPPHLTSPQSSLSFARCLFSELSLRREASSLTVFKAGSLLFNCL